MYLERFQIELPTHYDNFYHPAAFSSTQYECNDYNFPQGKETKYIGHLLNFAVSLMEPEEVHVELGESCMRSLAYAMHNRYNHMHYAIGMNGRFKEWIRKNRYPHLRILEKSYVDVLKRKPPMLRYNSIGVCYFPVEGGYRDKLRILRMLEPFLAKQAIVVINDANTDEIRKIVERWINYSPAAFMLYDLPTPYENYPTWGNGIQIVGYLRR